MRMGTGGMGVCLLGTTKWVVLCSRALPGELVSCRITAVKKGMDVCIAAVACQRFDPAAPAGGGPTTRAVWHLWVSAAVLVVIYPSLHVGMCGIVCRSTVQGGFFNIRL